MKKILILFIFSCTVFYSQSQSNTMKTISGIVFHKGKPLPEVTVSISKNSKKGTITDTNGKFSINANLGDVLIFKYLGYKTKKIFVDENTTVLNINMKIDENMLDGITISTKERKEKKAINRFEERDANLDEVLKMGRLNVNTRSSGFNIKYINGKQLNQGLFNLPRALRGLVPGLRVEGPPFQEQVYLRASNFINGPPRPVLWDIDGVITSATPEINISQIEHIAVVSSLGAANSYGAQGAGGVIIISTKSDYRNKKNRKKIRDLYLNDEFYKGDAVPYDAVMVGKPDYLDDFKAATNVNDALIVYKNQYKNHNQKNNYHLDIYNFFDENFNDKNSLLKILEDFGNAKNNVQDLKTIAYKYQDLDNADKAIATYKKIANLKPRYAQSFRDLANAYYENKDDKNAWKIFKYYLDKGYKIEENDIGELFSSEMIQTYMKRKQDPNFKETFQLEIEDKIVKSDVRLVFEWNNSDAEFQLEFVNSDKQSFTIENSLDAANDLIIDQKIKGYTSKEFMIEKFNQGSYLINITYLGNKTYRPTILKLTTYYNWGKENQTKEIDVFELKVENLKIQLKNLNPKKILN